MREVGIVLKGEQQRTIRTHNQNAWLAWHTAFLTAYAPGKSKKFWRLRDLTIGEPVKPANQGWRAEFAAFTAWVKSLKGTKH